MCGRVGWRRQHGQWIDGRGRSDVGCILRLHRRQKWAWQWGKQRGWRRVDDEMQVHRLGQGESSSEVSSGGNGVQGTSRCGDGGAGKSRNRETGGGSKLKTEGGSGV